MPWVTVQTIFGPPRDMTPEGMAAGLAEQTRKTCANVTHNVIAQSSGEILFERATTSCAPIRDEYSIVKIVRSFRAAYFVTYAKTSPLSEPQRQKWIGLVGASGLLNECKETAP